MYNPISSIIRQAKRKPNEPLNILTFPTHERYETGLCLTGHNFYAYRAEGIKDWNTDYAPLPNNYTLLNPDMGHEQIPSFVEFDLVLSQNKFGQFQLAYPLSKHMHVPLVSLEHTLPVPRWTQEQRTALANMRGNVNIFISEYSINQWQWQNHNDTFVIHHMVDTDVFKPKNIERQNHILSVVNDWINRDWCQPAGQKILTSNGYIPIEKINVGDIVLTDDGSYHTIIKTFERRYYGDIIKIKLDRNKDYIYFTPDHNIRVYRDNQEKYVAANRLRIGDQLKFPKITQIDFNLLPTPENEDYAYLIGSIIADGHITAKGAIEISVELKDKNRAKKLCNILKDITGTCTIVQNDSIYIVRCSSLIFSTWLKEKIGTYSKTKSIPEFLFLGHDKIKLKILQGLWHCDGSFKCEKKRGVRLCYSTTSIKLASQVSALLHYFGIKCSIKKEKRTTNKSNGKTVFIYRVISQDKDNVEKCKKLINQSITNVPYAYIITDYVIEEYNGIVYNCEVEKDPSYVVYPGFIAHNCCNFQGWQRITQNLPAKVVGDTPGLSLPSKSLEELVTIYSSSRIFLNTSVISPVPTALLEAMACGCAVVSTATCMIPEIIEHGVNGFISNDESELRKYCHTLLHDKDLAEHMGQNAINTIKTKFNKETFVNKWNTIFRSVL